MLLYKILSQQEETEQMRALTPAEALKSLRESAEQGNEVAQVNLAGLYLSRHSYREALKCYRKAADSGDAIAQHSIGYMYEKG